MSKSLAIVPLPHVSPLALRFEEAITPSRFLVQVREASEQQLLREIAQHANQSLGVALAGAKIALEGGTIQVVFKGGIPASAKLLKSGKHLIPMLVDGKTNRFLKTATIVTKGRVAASVAANAALIVVEAAHMISGYDNAKRLKSVERGVDRLIHAHESRLKSKLEGIYRYSKELLHEGPNALCEEDRRALHHQVRELMQVRAEWRDDFKFRMSKVDRADPGWVSKVLFWKREAAMDKRRKSKAAESHSALEIVQLMHFSLVLQMALAGASGKMDPFCKCTLPDEAHLWRDLAEFGRQRVREIVNGDGQAEFNDFLNALEGLSEFWDPQRWLTKGERPVERTSQRAIRKKHVSRGERKSQPKSARKTLARKTLAHPGKKRLVPVGGRH